MLGDALLALGASDALLLGGSGDVCLWAGIPSLSLPPGWYSLSVCLWVGTPSLSASGLVLPLSLPLGWYSLSLCLWAGTPSLSLPLDRYALPPAGYCSARVVHGPGVPTSKETTPP